MFSTMTVLLLEPGLLLGPSHSIVRDPVMLLSLTVQVRLYGSPVVGEQASSLMMTFTPRENSSSDVCGSYHTIVLLLIQVTGSSVM